MVDVAGFRLADEKCWGRETATTARGSGNGGNGINA
jgi:hypothetical protein